MRDKRLTKWFVVIGSTISISIPILGHGITLEALCLLFLVSVIIYMWFDWCSE